MKDSILVRAFGRGMDIAAIPTVFLMITLGACGKKDSSFSLLSDSKSFHQAEATVNNKIDILWVIDNSGSMAPIQQNLINNYATFMNAFLTKGFDFQMAVITSDAYLAASNYLNLPQMARFKDGAGSTHSGVYIVTQNDPNALNDFMINANQGATGAGDERAFQSLLDALGSPLNAGFPRSGAFFAVVILSDEDDFSNYSRAQNGGVDHDYNQVGLVTIDAMISQLEQITASTPTRRNFNVSTITVANQACQDQHHQETAASIIGARYMELANKTSGIIGSVCDTSFASSLNFIQQRIVELSTIFPLDRQPNISTIQVRVNNQILPNDPVNGWTYIADQNAIQFHGSGVPSAGAPVAISYDPTGLQ